MLIAPHTTYSASGLHPATQTGRRGGGVVEQTRKRRNSQRWHTEATHSKKESFRIKSVAEQNKAENNLGRWSANQFFVFLNYISRRVIKKAPFPEGNKSTKLRANAFIHWTCAVDVIRQQGGLHHPLTSVYTYYGCSPQCTCCLISPLNQRIKQMLQRNRKNWRFLLWIKHREGKE